MSARLCLVLALPVLGGCGLWPSPSEQPAVDDCTPTVWFVDQDGDGAGSPFGAVEACEAPASMVDNALDCDDSDAAQVPGARWFLDEDGDGFGDAQALIEGCSRPLGYVADDTDCDDQDRSRNPDSVWYVDADADGFGDASRTVPSCEARPDVAVPDDQDCDDADAARHPDANEVCDGTDNNCDGRVDDDDPYVDIFTQVTTYRDDDGDGWGTEEIVGMGCPATTTDALRPGDCDDTDANIFPLRLDYLDGVDSSCDGVDHTRLSTSSAGWRGDARNQGFAENMAVGDVDGDGVAELLIGEDRSQSGAGRVHLLRAAAPGGPTPLPDVGVRAWSGSAAGMAIGRFMALHPDLDADGTGEIFLTHAGWDGGAGRVFRVAADAPDGLVVDVATAVWAHPAPGAEFGQAYLALGDRMLISARRAENNGGRVYLADADTTDGSDPTTWPTLQSEARGDRLGFAMARVGDMDGDGVADVAISAPFQDAGVQDSGAVYILPETAFDDGVVTLDDAIRTLTGTSRFDLFGLTLAAVHDIDGDGLSDLAVGNPGADTVARDAGVVWVVRGDSASHSDDGAARAWWRVTGAGEADRVGESVAGPGDIDGDGVDDVLIGAPGDSRGGLRSGAVVGLMGGGEPGSLDLSGEEDGPGLWVVGQRSYERMGEVMQPAGDVDGDGLGDSWVAVTGGYGGVGAVYLLLGAERR